MISFIPDTVKGFQDFLPPESLKRKKVKEIIEKNFEIYGFLPVETPIVEYDELMRPDTLPIEMEDEAVSDRFRLKDKGGRNLGLRYEFTFQLARIFKQNPNIRMPFRRYQIGPLFRDEPIGTGRFRQFVQCDADIVGDASRDAEAECLSLVSDILKELNIKNTEIQINNRKLLASIIESTEIKNVQNVMKELDKIDKIGEDIVKSNLRKYASTNQILTLFKLLGKSLEFFQENAFDGAEEVIELMEKCRERGFKVEFNPFMIRGLGYYTGNIFEIREEGKPSIAAGGRYDNLVGKYIGQEIPAVGVSFGLERISSVSEIKIDSIPKCIIIPIEKDKEAVKLIKKIRKEGISSITGFGKTGKQLEYANSQGIPYAIFIGAEEVKKKKFKVKSLGSGEESLMTEKQLINKLKKL